MNDQDLFKRACEKLGEDPDTVMTWRVYADHIALVVNHGIAGCPKHIVPLEDLTEPEPEPAPEPLPEPDATDAARELASANGLDLRAITGTGAGGRIIKADVSAALGEV